VSPVNSSPDMPLADDNEKKKEILDTGETIGFELNQFLYVIYVFYVGDFK